MFKNFLIIIFAFQLLLVSCNTNTSKNTIDEFELPDVNIKINRYGKALFELDTNNLLEGLISIKPQFNYFLDADIENAENLNQLRNFVRDTTLIHIYKKSIEVFPNNDLLNEELTSAFKYLKYYYPNFRIPYVYTYISGLQYEEPIWIQDSVMIIALDVYLGGDFPPYSGLGLPKYKLKCMRPENISIDIMKYIYQTNIATNTNQNTLLDRMIAGGKLLYFLDRILPVTDDTIKICYTKTQLDWAVNNEKNIWAFLIQNDLLYSTNYQAQTKLIQDGPFTAAFSQDSPARLGVWIGWQIVRDFMDNNPNIGLNALFSINDSQEILTKSRYKP